MTGIQVTKRTLKTANTDRNKAASPNFALPKRSLNKTYKRKTHGFNSLAPLLWRAGVLAPVATGILARRPVSGAEVLSSVSQHLCGDACWTRETAAREAVESSSCPSPLPAGTPGNTGRGSCPMSPRGKGAQHLWPCISQRRRSLTLT